MVNFQKHELAPFKGPRNVRPSDRLMRTLSIKNFNKNRKGWIRDVFKSCKKSYKLAPGWVIDTHSLGGQFSINNSLGAF